MKYISTYLIPLILVGCATPMAQRSDISQADVQREAELQKEMFFRGYVKTQARLLSIAYPILINSTDMCDKKVAPYFGVWIESAKKIDEEYAETFKGIYGYTDDAKIINVVENSPAYLAGIKTGDSVKSIGGNSFSDTSEKGFKKMRKTMDEIKPGTPAVFELERNGQTVFAEITPLEACDYPAIVIMDNTLNAFADGKAVYVTKGMMRFTESDDELALVVGHELAHNTMQHISAKKKNYWFGAIFDVIAAGYGIDTQGLFGQLGVHAYSQDFESEADYVGLYHVARGGYDISEAPMFWRRMAAEHPDNIKGSYGSTHPSSSQRFVHLENTVKEILTKQGAGEPLLPNMKPRPSQTNKKKTAAGGVPCATAITGLC